MAGIWDRVLTTYWIPSSMLCTRVAPILCAQADAKGERYVRRPHGYISNKEISRNSASRIFQLRVGHAPLNQYLHRFKRADSPRCPACGHPKETPEHFLLHCPSYEHERWPIKNAIGGRLPKIARLLTDPKLLGPLNNFIEVTGRYELDAGIGDFPVRAM
jgi:hypothetical protein